MDVGAAVTGLPAPRIQAACAVAMSSNIIFFLYATILPAGEQLSKGNFVCFSFTIESQMVWFCFNSPYMILLRSIALIGLKPQQVSIEIDVQPGIPSCLIVGL